jgi:hypothetical protein
LPEKTGLVSPFINDLIDKIDNKSDADKKIRTLQEITIIMSDHEVDLVDAEQHDEKGVKKTKIRGKIPDMIKNKVFNHPYQGREDQKGIEDLFSRSQQPPYMELPGNDQPFDQRIGITGCCIGNMCYSDEITVHQFGDDPDGQQNKKGPVALSNTIEAYQPCNKCDQNRLTEKEYYK